MGLRGKGDAKTLKSLRWKVAFYGGIFIICKVFVCIVWVYEYRYRDSWLKGHGSGFPDINLIWSRHILTLVGGLVAFIRLCRSNQVDMFVPHLESEQKSRNFSWSGIQSATNGNDQLPRA